MLVVGVFAHKRHGTCHFAACGEALKDPEQDQQGRSGPEDDRVRRDEADAGGGPGDEEQEDGEQVLAAQAVTQETTDDAAEGAGKEAHQEADVGQEQGADVLGTHDVHGQVRGQQAVDAVVVPFHEGTHGAGKGCLAHHPAVSGYDFDLSGVQFH